MGCVIFGAILCTLIHRRSADKDYLISSNQDPSLFMEYTPPIPPTGVNLRFSLDRSMCLTWSKTSPTNSLEPMILNR